MPALAALWLLCGLPASAFALEGGDHESVTWGACRDAGLPYDFCRRAAVEAASVDGREWADLAAHAQAEEGLPLCVGADLTLARMETLGGELRAALAGLQADRWGDDAEDAAVAFGRALHTIQDNCAHQGMTNPEHSWYTRSDLCHDTDLSPDVQPEALECARVQTRVVMQGLAPLVEELGVARALGDGSCPEPQGGEGGGSTTSDPCWTRVNPGPISVCRFIRSVHVWDGIDRRWDTGTMADLMSAAWLDALHGLEPDHSSTCDLNDFEAASAEPVVDLSDGPPDCGLLNILCLGPDDSFAGSAPAAATSAEPAGCSVAARPTAGGSAPFALLLALLLATRARRGR